jgi:predicted nucleic acid-binding protein
MAIVYFDSSALVKLVVEEEGSNIASALWDGCDAALSSRLAYPEVCAALAAAHRNQDLDDRGFAMAARDWDEFWAATRQVELTVDVERRAGELAKRRGLRGADAVHLASALAIESPSLLVAVWDRRLHDGVVAEHLNAAPKSLPT